MRNVSAVVSFDEGRVTVDKERYTEWKLEWQNLWRNGSAAEKELQWEIPKQYD